MQPRPRPWKEQLSFRHAAPPLAILLDDPTSDARDHFSTFSSSQYSSSSVDQSRKLWLAWWDHQTNCHIGTISTTFNYRSPKQQKTSSLLCHLPHTTRKRNALLIGIVIDDPPTQMFNSLLVMVGGAFVCDFLWEGQIPQICEDKL